MSEYIKKEDAIDSACANCIYDEFLSDRKKRIKEGITEISPADVVEVVRCKNCRHNGSFDTDCPFGWRDERFNLPDDMDFCSYGER